LAAVMPPGMISMLPGKAGILPGKAGILPGKAAILAGKAAILAGKAAILPGKASILPAGKNSILSTGKAFMLAALASHVVRHARAQAASRQAPLKTMVVVGVWFWVNTLDWWRL